MDLLGKLVELNNPRLRALEAMKQSVPEEVWAQNAGFTKNLRAEIKKHQLNFHGVIDQLMLGLFDEDALRDIHLDYRHAIVQIFTDALTMAQAQSRQLEPRLPPGSRIAPRFLLTLNCLDEFGFQPGIDEADYYKGNPSQAHYPLFEQLMDDMQISDAHRREFKPSKQACAVRSILESSFQHYQSVLLLLAVAEEQVILFSPALRTAVERAGIDVHDGYYFVHGVTSEDHTNAADDDHEEDLWNALNQACTPQDYKMLSAFALSYLDLWDEFWTHQANRISDQIHSSKLPKSKKIPVPILVATA